VPAHQANDDESSFRSNADAGSKATVPKTMEEGLFVSENKTHFQLKSTANDQREAFLGSEPELSPRATQQGALVGEATQPRSSTSGKTPQLHAASRYSQPEIPPAKNTRHSRQRTTDLECIRGIPCTPEEGRGC